MPQFQKKLPAHHHPPPSTSSCQDEQAKVDFCLQRGSQGNNNKPIKQIIRVNSAKKHFKLNLKNLGMSCATNTYSYVSGYTNPRSFIRRNTTFPKFKL